MLNMKRKILRKLLLAVDYFCQKAPLYTFDWVLNTPQLNLPDS